LKAIVARLCLSQASSGTISGVFLPFFGAFLAWRGLSPGWIGLILSLSLILRAFAGPMSGIAADARNDRRAVMQVLYWVMLTGFAALIWLKAPFPILLAGVFAYVAYGSATPLLESVSVRIAERHGVDYGRVRIWASSAFVVMSVFAGMAVHNLGLFIVAPLLAMGSLFCVTATFLLPAPAKQAAPAALLPRLKATFDETRELLRSPVFLIFLLTASFEQASHGFYYGYGGLHWLAIGYSPSLVSIIWPLGVLGEILLFSQAKHVRGVLGPTQLLLAGGVFCILRWSILAFDPPLPLVLIAQFMHGGTFAMAHLGAVFFILRAVPQRLAATAQSLYFVTSQGIMMGITTIVSGSAYPFLGSKAYLLMTLSGAAGIGLALLLGKRWHGERILKEADTAFIDAI
jgi:MFS transporter, PPP family, 3-phenylpropionic acid transporter